MKRRFIFCARGATFSSSLTEMFGCRAHFARFWTEFSNVARVSRVFGRIFRMSRAICEVCVGIFECRACFAGFWPEFSDVARVSRDFDPTTPPYNTTLQHHPKMCKKPAFWSRIEVSWRRNPLFCKKRQQNCPPPFCPAKKMLLHIIKRTLFTIVFSTRSKFNFWSFQTLCLVEKYAKNIGRVENWCKKLSLGSCFWSRAGVSCSFLVANRGFVEKKHGFLNVTRVWPDFDEKIGMLRAIRNILIEMFACRVHFARFWPYNTTSQPPPARISQDLNRFLRIQLAKPCVLQ